MPENKQHARRVGTRRRPKYTSLLRPSPSLFHSSSCLLLQGHPLTLLPLHPHGARSRCRRLTMAHGNGTIGEGIAGLWSNLTDQLEAELQNELPRQLRTLRLAGLIAASQLQAASEQMRRSQAWGRSRLDLYHVLSLRLSRLIGRQPGGPADPRLPVRCGRGATSTNAARCSSLTRLRPRPSLQR